ncbi:hypothetical protein BU26DRAFT_499990 [Trematosphaeria pertusa]|uniref:Uncharacterized protein n=1 Tax=Trematosphaeria pertusa TaxID=390896 RepID=A0A6A6IUE6_9PLEO|nr:uncharacterized protein BU26DRAFT_499990 [Trematosphaeria pertusa]KAF2254185.1 hypothetical protein BU26DRAFT_499990 [Trematosphaeria pertusa]
MRSLYAIPFISSGEAFLLALAVADVEDLNIVCSKLLLHRLTFDQTSTPLEIPEDPPNERLSPSCRSEDVQPWHKSTEKNGSGADNEGVAHHGATTEPWHEAANEKGAPESSSTTTMVIEKGANNTSKRAVRADSYKRCARGPQTTQNS